MNKPQLDNRIMGGMPKMQGGGYDSMTGCNHNGVADTISDKIDSKSITLNKELDPRMAKPSNKNPGVDMGFLNKGNATTDSTGHGKLTRSCQD